MPISDTTIDLAKQRVERDIRDGFAERLSPSADADPVFTIELEESVALGYPGLAEADAVATSESVVVVPWVYHCVHTGPFLEIPPTFVSFDLRGTTFVNVGLGDNPATWILHRFVDFLCALHHIGVYTSVRPALNVQDYLRWDEARRGPAA